MEFEIASPSALLLGRKRRSAFWLAVLAAYFLLWIPATAFSADRIILRNLELVADRTVIAVDEDGARLDAKRPGLGDVIPWSDIEQGRVNADLQKEFDRFLKELGPLLFRLKQRIKIGDYAGLHETAEKVYPLYASRQSQTAYLVCQATMWGRLATGKREGAVEPYLRCQELLRRGTAKGMLLPGTRRLDSTADHCYCPDLVPLWFDKGAAKEALPGIQEAIRRISLPRPEEAYLYFASLAATAEDYPAAQKVLDAVKGQDPGCQQWKTIIQAQMELQQGAPAGNMSTIRAEAAKLQPELRGVAHYWLAAANSNSQDETSLRDAALDFLFVPAQFEEQDREVSAAGLYQALLVLVKLKDEQGAAAIRRELAAEYGDTTHGRKLREQEKK